MLRGAKHGVVWDHLSTCIGQKFDPKSFDGQGVLKTEYWERVDPCKHWSEPQCKIWSELLKVCVKEALKHLGVAQHA